MKNHRILAALLAAILLLALAGCGGGGKSASPAVGTWVGQYTKLVGDTDDARSPETFSLELKADGSGVHHRDDMEFKVSWKLDGEDFSMDEKFIGDPIHYTGKLSGDDLNLFNGDPENIWTYEYVYVREGGTSAKPAPAAGTSGTAGAPAESAAPAAPAASEAPVGTEAPAAPGPAAPTSSGAGETGKFMIYEYEAGGQKINHEMLVESGMGDTYLQLDPDGTGTLDLFHTPMDITWTPGVVTVYGTSNYTYEMADDDTLILDMQGVKYVMLRDDGTGTPAGAPAPAETPAPTGAPAPAETPAPTEAPAPETNAPHGSGIVSEEQLQKGYVWMNKVAKDIFHTTYEELAAYFGVDGAFDKEEYSEHMKVNKRYYKWISEDDDTHFIYVNFEEDEPDTYTVSSFNTSGFSGPDAVTKYLDALLDEAREADKAAAAAMAMKDFSITISPFGKKDDTVTVNLQIPASGWSFDEKKVHLVDNEDPGTFGAGFIQFKLEDDVADFDFYKDKFENYQDIEAREVGGVVMQGRTYKNIGYEWTEYIAQLDETHAVSIGIVRVDVSSGTIGDRILNSVRFG